MLFKCLEYKNFISMSMGQSQLGRSSPSLISHDNTAEGYRIIKYLEYLTYIILRYFKIY